MSMREILNSMRKDMCTSRYTWGRHQHANGVSLAMDGPETGCENKSEVACALADSGFLFLLLSTRLDAEDNLLVNSAQNFTTEH